MMSAITLTDFKKVRMYSVEKSVKNFAKKFKIKVYNEKNIDDALSNNDINVYVNFSSTCYEVILKSMDRGIPCIVGKTISPPITGGDISFPNIYYTYEKNE